MEEQRVWTGAKWHEEQVFEYLRHRLPGDYVFLNNRILNGRAINAKGTEDSREYDLILLGKFAVYVVEIKHVMGKTISGNGATWDWDSDNRRSGRYEIPSPLKQLREQKNILIAKFKENGLRIPIIDCVCILCDEKPKIEVDDIPENLQKIFWYKEIDPFLTDPQLPAYIKNVFRDDAGTDISNQHERLKKLIDSNFTSKVLSTIAGYEIVDDAWTSRRYKAYYARQKGEHSQKVVLKVYTVPDNIATDKEIDQFIQKINGQDFDALRKLRESGDNATGGGEYVLGIRDAYLYPKDKRSYVVISDWVDGKPLSQLLNQISSYASRYLIASQVCRGMAFLHSANVAHRHLSLDSLIWSKDEGKVRITNFDFAKFTDLKNVSVHPPDVAREIEAEMRENSKYLAPELVKINADQIDSDPTILYHRANEFTDLYSIGVILLELFTSHIQYPETVKTRLKQAPLTSAIRDILAFLCSDNPVERKSRNLLNVAEVFENLHKGETGGMEKISELTNLQPGSMVNSYEIIEKLHHTDMSEIYLAKDVVMGFKVVIKLPRAGENEEILDELRRGKQISDDIKSKNCAAQLLNYNAIYVANGKIDVQPSTNSRRVFYQVWEYIEGGDLGMYIKGNNDPVLERLSLCQKVLAALGALHEKQWVHGDIKPQNFMRTPDGDIRIIDFGLSRRTGDKSKGGGTPGYMSPEKELTKTSDVWSIGRLMLVILFGRKYEPTPLNPELEVDWDEMEISLGVDFTRVFQKALQSTPEMRYPTALEFIEEFDSAFQKWHNNTTPEKTVAGTGSEKGSQLMDYDQILERLKEERDDAVGLGDTGTENKIADDLRALEKWLVGGQKGNCPVDLGKYSIGHEERVSVAALSELPVSVDLESVAIDEAERAQENLRLELEQARGHVKNKEWREAVALTRQVEGLAKGELKETARDLLDRAQVQLNKELEKVLAKGDAARTKNNDDKAREQYQAALAIDESNSHARLALQELDGLIKDKVSKEQQDRLRAGLSDHRDIHRLGEAVYDAEALEGEGKLPSKLAALLKEARDYFDKTRRTMGEETTQMRFGDIALRADAVAKLQARVAGGAKTIYDQTTDTDRPAFEVLREAQTLLQQACEDTAQYEINIAEKFKAIRPGYAHQRLTKALEQPFYEQEKRKLEEKLAEVEQFIHAEEKAESLQTQAMEEKEPIRKLEILIQANQIFSGIPGLREQVFSARPVALSALQSGIKDALQRADVSIRSQKYGEARNATNEAELQSARWPEPQMPEEIDRLLDEARGLRKRIDETENAWREYEQLAEDIRQKVVDTNQRGAALALFKQVSQDERFRGFPDLRSLTTEIDQYKGMGDQLNDANTARDKNDWHRVFEITDRVLKAGTAGKLAGRFQELHTDAVTELSLQRAQELLENDEIPEANNVLSATLNRERERSPERENALRSRMSVELERIQQAIHGNKTMQEWYDRACDLLNLRDSQVFKAYTSPSFALRQSKVGADGDVSSPEMRALINRLKDSPNEEDPSPEVLIERAQNVLLAELHNKVVGSRLQALRLFRFVGGKSDQAAQAGWPEYVISLRMAEARRASRLLSESLRAGVLQPLLRGYAEHQGRESELKDESLREMAKQVEALQEANLFETDNERAAGRWAEVEWGKREASLEEKRSNWQGAVSIWSRLDNNHPGTSTVKHGLRNARIQQAVNRAHYLVHNDHNGKDALTLLKGLQAESDMDNAWELHLALAETYENLGEFESAFGNMSQAQRVIANLDGDEQRKIRSQLDQKRVELERRQIIYTCIEEARKAMAGSPAEAIRVLQAGIENPTVTDSTPLRNLHDDIFKKTSQDLINKAKEEQDKGSDEGKIQAVTALVELQTLEELTGRPLEKRRSIAELNRLRTDLASVANAVVMAAGDFDPQTMPLAQAITEASSISARLQTFDNVTNVFTEELEPVREKLTKRRRDIGTILENLQSLERTLQEAGNQKYWEFAIQNSDFEILQQYFERVRKLELNGMQEVHSFERRLSETQESYQYLLDIIGQIRQKFSVDEDFVFVMNRILESKVQPPYRKNNQTWQIIHAREYEDMRVLLNERMRVPDVYGRSDLVGWQKVLEQAEEREKELGLWREWDKTCARYMDIAERDVKITRAHPSDLPTRVKKIDWEKGLETARAAISALTYPKEEKFTDPVDGQEKTREMLVIGTRDIRDIAVPIRSRAVKDIQEAGKHRKEIADQWVYAAEMQIDALQAVLEQRGFPTAEEFKNATFQSDWDRLEGLLTRAREAGVTNASEQNRVATYAKVLENERKKQNKKSWWSR